VGNAVEWHDWYLYTFLTPVFARVAFGGNQVSTVLSSFAAPPARTTTGTPAKR
jgi:MFS transporter, MHS family, alpha-ketoglutarate permease